MVTIKMARVNSEVNKALANIIQYELNDPRLNDGSALITVLKSEITKDMKYCKTYISVYPIEKGKEMVELLNNCKGYIRRALKTKVLLRNLPELHFVIDKGIEYENKIMKILDELGIKNDEDDESEEEIESEDDKGEDDV